MINQVEKWDGREGNQVSANFIHPCIIYRRISERGCFFGGDGLRQGLAHPNAGFADNSG